MNRFYGTAKEERLPGTTLALSPFARQGDWQGEMPILQMDFYLVRTNTCERKYHHSNHFDGLRADVIIAQFTSLSPKGFRVKAYFPAQLTLPDNQRKTAREDN